jgi:hypothetical protein
MVIPILVIFIFAVVILFISVWLLKYHGGFKQPSVKPPSLLQVGTDLSKFDPPSLWSTPFMPAKPGTGVKNCQPSDVSTCAVYNFNTTNYAPPSFGLNDLHDCIEPNERCYQSQLEVSNCVFPDQLQARFGTHTCINYANTQSGLNCVSSIDGSPVKLGETECAWATCDEPLPACDKVSLNFISLNFDPSFIIPPGKNWDNNPFTALKCITLTYFEDLSTVNTSIDLQPCNIKKAGFETNNCTEDEPCISNLWIFTFYSFDENGLPVVSKTGSLCSIMDRNTGRYLAPEGHTPGRYYNPDKSEKLTLIVGEAQLPGIWWYFSPNFKDIVCPTIGFPNCEAPPQLVFIVGWQFFLLEIFQTTDLYTYLKLGYSISFIPNASQNGQDDCKTVDGVKSCRIIPPCPTGGDYESCTSTSWPLTMEPFVVTSEQFFKGDYEDIPPIPFPPTGEYLWNIGTDPLTQKDRFLQTRLPVTLFNTRLIDYTLYTNIVTSAALYDATIIEK